MPLSHFKYFPSSWFGRKLLTKRGGKLHFCMPIKEALTADQEINSWDNELRNCWLGQLLWYSGRKQASHGIRRGQGCCFVQRILKKRKGWCNWITMDMSGGLCQSHPLGLSILVYVIPTNQSPFVGSSFGRLLILACPLPGTPISISGSQYFFSLPLSLVCSPSPSPCLSCLVDLGNPSPAYRISGRGCLVALGLPLLPVCIPFPSPSSAPTFRVAISLSLSLSLSLSHSSSVKRSVACDREPHSALLQTISLF